MSRRVLLGQRGGVPGMWVSRPGVDVVSASADDLLMSTDITALQIIASGVIASASSGQTYDRTIPNLGFSPIVLMGGSHIVSYSFPNATTLRVHVGANTWGAGGNAVTWAVTNLRILH